MTFDQDTGALHTYQYDYGVPVVFDAYEKDGFTIGDKIVFVFDTEAIDDKEYTVSSDEFSFEMKLEKAEADALFADQIGLRQIPYSVKRYNASNVFLETIVNSVLNVEGTQKWKQD